tara:strand:+ start:1389 stop:1634 length:246 start_codon:yes stop_codon:yes gene_type:complete
MANYSTSDFNIVGATTDYGADSTRFQVQSTATPTFTFFEFEVVLGNLSASEANVTTSLRAGWLTGRRPVSGQLFPRGVYNR